MSVKQIVVERFSITSSKSFDEIVRALEAAIGRPDFSVFGNSLKSAKTFQDVETIVNGVVGPSGFMEFARFDLGAILRKERGGDNRGFCGW